MGTFENLDEGQTIITPGKTLTQAAATIIIGLSGYTISMFNDEEYSKKHTPFGGMVVPGEMTVLFMGGLVEMSGVLDNTTIAMLGMDNIRFKFPARPGDTLYVEMKVKTKKKTSKGDKGIITFEWICMNQNDEILVELDASLMFKIA